MRMFAIAMIALATGAAAPAQAAARGPIVRTVEGQVQGEALPDGGGVFRGIRFAQPPVGDLRWQPPQPAKPWSGIRSAVSPHASCPQPVYGEWNRAASESGNEDCLFLDVRTPTLDAKAKLPVLVWIHGGGNRGGAGSGTVESRITDQGIVLVSVQYRLGALGFMAHPALSAEQGGSSGNYGLMDQQAALRWVQDNIAAFGGDPKRVTIAGESAGAQDVGLQRLSPAARGLFQAAIAESGTPGFGVAPRSLAQGEALGASIVTAAGAPADADVATLRKLPVADIIRAQEAVDVPTVPDKSFIWLQTLIDGRVLTSSPRQSFATGNFAHTPYLIGVNKQEFTGYGGQDLTPVIRAEFAGNADKVLAAYGLAGQPATDGNPRLGDAAMQLGTDLVFRCPTIAVSDVNAATGIPLWQYQFDYAPRAAASPMPAKSAMCLMRREQVSRRCSVIGSIS